MDFYRSAQSSRIVSVYFGQILNTLDDNEDKLVFNKYVVFERYPPLKNYTSSSSSELYCHSATCGDIQWNEMSCLTGPRCYINTDIQQ